MEDPPHDVGFGFVGPHGLGADFQVDLWALAFKAIAERAQSTAEAPISSMPRLSDEMGFDMRAVWAKHEKKRFLARSAEGMERAAREGPARRNLDPSKCESA